MSWGWVYRLKWRELDRDQIEAAARVVTASLPGSSVEVTARGGWADWIDCYFRLSLALARALEPSPDDLERRALQWSQLRGARSGRVAWQFTRDLAGELGMPLPY